MKDFSKTAYPIYKILEKIKFDFNADGLKALNCLKEKILLDLIIVAMD